MRMDFVKSESESGWSQLPWLFAITGLVLASVWMGSKVTRDRGEDVGQETSQEDTASR